MNKTQKKTGSLVLFILLGAFLNRVRGGLFKWLPCNKVLFSLLFSFIAGFYSSFDVNVCICTFIAVFAGQQCCGWGKYIGALTTGEVNPDEVEVYAIDKICERFIDKPRLYGFITLGLRGIIWTFPIGLVINNIWYILSGALMPVCYSIPTLLLLKTKHNKDKTAWNIGEWIWGGVMSGLFVLALWR